MAWDELVLHEQARAAYERGRFHRAAPGALLALPYWTVGVTTCAEPLVASVSAVVLAAASVLLLWRGRHFVSALRSGLSAGAVVLAIPLAGMISGLCGSAWLLCAAAGVVGGATLALGRARREPSATIAAGVVAALAGAQGCLLLGLPGLLAMTAGLAAATAPALVPALRHGR